MYGILKCDTENLEELYYRAVPILLVTIFALYEAVRSITGL